MARTARVRWRTYRTAPGQIPERGAGERAADPSSDTRALAPPVYMGQLPPPCAALRSLGQTEGVDLAACDRPFVSELAHSTRVGMCDDSGVESPTASSGGHDLSVSGVVLMKGHPRSEEHTSELQSLRHL